MLHVELVVLNSYAAYMHLLHLREFMKVITGARQQTIFTFFTSFFITKIHIPPFFILYKQKGNLSRNFIMVKNINSLYNFLRVSVFLVHFVISKF